MPSHALIPSIILRLPRQTSHEMQFTSNKLLREQQADLIKNFCEVTTTAKDAGTAAKDAGAAAKDAGAAAKEAGAVHQVSRTEWRRVR